ncbi:phosphoglycerate mutase-like protein [Trichoderma citrinoviride]|uniref:Phosphoglycerate mutase-like protein n=1 Tax=Trichoderma citrinoviride TaxID=58853 RepID=A0A2T4BAY5_9HYPO|nr:phosphoglycerate mutase-like protein [Trichoderma citrinoviride]PTB66477.1 phosphoglycerate mutase-like protein [Trichoderma citrinoviride]
MAKPRLIILIRHAQSEGNKNREIHQTIPDHRVKLTPEGWTQAHEAGRRLRKLLRPDDTLQFFTSPYRRTRETTEGILATLTSDDPEPSPYRRSSIKVYEEPRLREQDFGNFQPCSTEMERMWQERADYGHFFYRIPDGESAADAYDRISGFNESLWRQFGDDDFPSVCVLVTHGLMSRVFLMKWYHFSVEYFEDLRNINHCEFLIMRKQVNGKYHLENKLRTWSELRRERAQALKDKDKEGGGGGDASGSGSDKNANGNGGRDDFKLQHTQSFVAVRRWGGCPNGCNHSAAYRPHNQDSDHALQQQQENKNGGGNGNNGSSSTSTLAARRQQRHVSSSGGSEDDDDDSLQPPLKAVNKRVNVEAARAFDDIVSSPDGTPSFITAEDRIRHIKATHMHVGRDAGGTYSGHASLAGSDTEASEDEAARRRRVVAAASLDSRIKAGTALANRLGDEPGTDCSAVEDLDDVEREDRSVMGSIY